MGILNPIGYPEGDNETLLQQLARSDPAAWATFLDRYADTLYTHIYHLMQLRCSGAPSDDCKDAVQGFYLSLLERQGRRLLLYEKREDASLETWLKVVATNYVRGELRKKGKVQSLENIPEGVLHQILKDLTSDLPLNPRDLATQNEILEQIYTLVEELSPRENLIFKLYYMDNLSRVQIAQIIGIKPNHVDQILHRIRKFLSHLLAA